MEQTGIIVGIYSAGGAGIEQAKGVIARIRRKRNVARFLVVRDGSAGSYWHTRIFDWCHYNFIEAVPCSKAELRHRNVAAVVTFGAPDWYVASMRARWGKIVWDLPSLEDVPPPPPPIDPNRPHLGEAATEGQRRRQILCRGACIGELHGAGPMVHASVFVPGGEHGRLFWSEDDALGWATWLLERNPDQKSDHAVTKPDESSHIRTK